MYVFHNCNITSWSKLFFLNLQSYNLGHVEIIWATVKSLSPHQDESCHVLPYFFIYQAFTYVWFLLIVRCFLFPTTYGSYYFFFFSKKITDLPKKDLRHGPSCTYSSIGKRKRSEEGTNATHETSRISLETLS